MESITYKFEIKKPTREQCKEAINAADALVKNLEHSDLLLLAKTAKENPGLIVAAREYMK